MPEAHPRPPLTRVACLWGLRHLAGVRTIGIRKRIAAAAAAAVIGSVVMPAEPASAVVLVNAPRSAAPVGGHLEIGVWYRTFDGGPRAYRVKVINPAGRAVFFRAGEAPTHWKIWRIAVHRVGIWRTVYRTKNDKGAWVRTTFRTKVHP